jgi:hypothetical protein
MNCDRQFTTRGSELRFHCDAAGDNADKCYIRSMAEPKAKPPALAFLANDLLVFTLHI